MKRSDNTEMDRLLRRHARSEGETLRARPDAGSGDHLDADELNAYAEGALPQATRSSYFAHLADCQTCRKLVTDLTLAAGGVVEGKQRAAVAEAAPSRSWREWLAALFSPPVLRYGAPALVLFGVIIVALVAMRANREPNSVAQRSAERENYAPAIVANSNSAVETGAATGTAGSHANSNAAPLAEPRNQTPPEPSATPLPAKTTQTETDAPSPPQPVAAPKPVVRDNDNKDSSGEFGIVASKRAEAPAATPGSNSPILSAPAGTAADNRAKREEQKKAKTGEKMDDEATFNESTADGTVAKQKEAGEDRRDVGNTATARQARSQPRSRPSTASKSGAADAIVSEKEASAEMRISGRRFRRRGSAWVDTDYNSSQATTNVARGSEQYRALVADEPGLRSITQQLGGEVIVVWKRRAYRFY
jgi:hypothetical protein